MLQNWGKIVVQNRKKKNLTFFNAKSLCEKSTWALFWYKFEIEFFPYP